MDNGEYTTGDYLKIGGVKAGRVNIETEQTKLEDHQCKFTVSGYIDTYDNFRCVNAKSVLHVATDSGQYPWHDTPNYDSALATVATSPGATSAKQHISGDNSVTISRKYGQKVKVRLAHQYYDPGISDLGTIGVFATKTYTLAARPYQLPKPPTSVTAAIVYDSESGKLSENTLQISWVKNCTDEKDARPWTGVKVYRYLNGSTSGTLIATVPCTYSGGSTTVTDADVQIGNQVVYGVKSYNSTGDSTQETQSNTVYTAPKAPSSVTATVTEETSSSTGDMVFNVAWAASGTASNTWDGVSVQRQLDDGEYVEIKKMSNSLFALKDTVGAGHKARYRVAGYNACLAYYPDTLVTSDATRWSDFTYATAVYTAPTAFTSIVATKSSTTTVALQGIGGSDYSDSVEWQRYYNDKWTDITLSGGSDTSAPTATIKYRARKKKGNLYSEWCESEWVENVRTPLAPTVTVTNLVLMGDAASVSWTRNHPDYTAQTAAEVEVKWQASGATETHTVAGTVATYSIGSPSGSAPIAIALVRVRTKGLADDYGAWSSYVTVTFSNALGAVITSPAKDYPQGDAITSGYIPVSVDVSSWFIGGTTYTETTWSTVTATISGYGVDESITLAEGATTTGTTSKVTTFNGAFSNPSGILSGKDYTITVTAASASGTTFNATATRAIHTNFTEPTSQFVVDVTVNDADLSVTLDVDIPAGYASSDIDHIGVSRVDQYGDWETIADRAKLGDQIVDKLPPLNVKFSYVVRGYNAQGGYNAQEFNCQVNSGGMEAFNFGPFANDVLLLGLDASGSRDFEFTGTDFQFATGSSIGPLPTFYADGTADASGSNSYKIHGQADYESAYTIIRKRTSKTFWFRDAWGHRSYCHGKWTLSYDATAYSLWNISVAPTQVMWRSPEHD